MRHVKPRPRYRYLAQNLTIRFSWGALRVFTSNNFKGPRALNSIPIGRTLHTRKGGLLLAGNGHKDNLDLPTSARVNRHEQLGSLRRLTVTRARGGLHRLINVLLAGRPLHADLGRLIPVAVSKGANYARGQRTLTRRARPAAHDEPLWALRQRVRGRRTSVTVHVLTAFCHLAT